MKKCTKCGSEFNSNFCPNCGIPADQCVDIPNPVFQTPDAPAKVKKKGLPKGCLIIFIVVIVFFVMLTAFGSGGDDASSAASSAQNTNGPGSAVASESESASEPKDDNLIDTNIGDVHLVYDHYDISTIGGAEYITVYYQFTNNSDSNQTFFLYVSAKAFQNGIELQSSVVYTSEETRTAEAEIKPGITTLVAQAYRLQDDSPVLLEVSPLISFSNEPSDSATIEIE